MRKKFIAKVALAAALLVTAAFSALAAEVKAVRVKQGPKVDGLLNDAVWQEATPYTGFRQVEPMPNGEPSEKTEVRVIYDLDTLFIGILCRDSEPGKIAANSLARDGGGGGGGMFGGGGWGHRPQGASEDVVRVLLDPFQDKRTAYLFFVNPRGARGEGLISGGESSLNWDGIWDAESRILEDGWSAEFRIPFKTISFNPTLTRWGINIERAIARKQETIRVSGVNRDSNFNNPMEAAALEGITGVHQGLGITFRPYGLASTQKNNLEGLGARNQLDGGFDIYKNFTPNLVGAVSYNMDFAETEVDERRINLTRFPLFFPEKRMFFLEGSETFEFSSSISFRPFFSRTIGLYQGNQIPVSFGTKLFGKVGGTNLSVLDVQTGKFNATDLTLPGTNFFAARVTQDIFSESKVGFIVTNGSPTGEHNTLAGVDFQYSTSKFLKNKNLMLAAWGAYNWNETADGRHHGFGFRANYPNDLWNVQSTYAYYGEALNPGMGYMMRQGIQTAFLMVGFQPRPTGGFLKNLVRQFYFNVSGDYYWDLTGKLETSRVSVTPFSVRTESGEVIGFGVTANRDVLPFDFEIAPGVIVPTGPYAFTNYNVSINSATHRMLSFDAGHSFGQFYSGHYNETTAGVDVKLKGYANLSLSLDLVRGRLPQGNFSENVYQLKADVFLSPDLGFMNYIQYDDISHQLGWSARVRWTVSPGNDIYLVYNKNWERRWDPTSRFYPLEGRGVFKISLSIRP